MKLSEDVDLAQVAKDGLAFVDINLASLRREASFQFTPEKMDIIDKSSDKTILDWSLGVCFSFSEKNFSVIIFTITALNILPLFL